MSANVARAKGGQGMEHKPWVGSRYASIGVDGQRIAIVGYSHWVNKNDHSELTISVVEDVIEGGNYGFFARIASYFGHDHSSAPDFWRSVVFFNFVPSSIGGPADRFGTARGDDIKRGLTRAWNIFVQHRPDKVLIFSSKVWREFPSTLEQECGQGACLEGPGFQWGNYKIGNRTLPVFGLRHPQGANTETMTSAVRWILDQPLGRGG